MRIKKIVSEWYQDYKLPSLYIGTISCNGKCCLENNLPITICQNADWRDAPIKNINDDIIIQKYLDNPITQAIIFGGLEPFEQYKEIFDFIKKFRNIYHCNDVIVIYTGYYREEIIEQIAELSQFNNIIIKFGRFIPNQESHFDDLLEVTLASPNQYAEQIS